jgi:hypothetical protein
LLTSYQKDLKAGAKEVKKAQTEGTMELSMIFGLYPL